MSKVGHASTPSLHINIQYRAVNTITRHDSVISGPYPSLTSISLLLLLSNLVHYKLL